MGVWPAFEAAAGSCWENSDVDAQVTMNFGQTRLHPRRVVSAHNEPSVAELRRFFRSRLTATFSQSHPRFSPLDKKQRFIQV